MQDVIRQALAHKDYSKIQILTVEGLLNGHRIDATPQLNPFAMAARESEREKQTRCMIPLPFSFR